MLQRVGSVLSFWEIVDFAYEFDLVSQYQVVRRMSLIFLCPVDGRYVVPFQRLSGRECFLVSGSVTVTTKLIVIFSISYWFPRVGKMTFENHVLRQHIAWHWREVLRTKLGWCLNILYFHGGILPGCPWFVSGDKSMNVPLSEVCIFSAANWVAPVCLRSRDRHH